MGNKLYQQTDLIVYEEITSGKLNPQLPQNGDLSILQNLIITANTKTFYICSIEDDPENMIDKFDITELGYHFREDAEIIVQQNSKKRVYEFIAKPKRIYPLEDLFDLPQPPDQKSEYFLALIADEFERVKIRASKVLIITNKKKHLTLFAHKNIQRAKKIRCDIRYWLNKIQKPWSSVTDNPDVYVIYVLDVFLSRIITFYQKLFQPFIMPFLSDDQYQSDSPFIPVYLKYPFLYQEFSANPYGYSLHMDRKILDFQFKDQRNKLPDYTLANYGYSKNVNRQTHEKSSLPQYKSIKEGTRLKWHGQLNVLVDIMLQLTSNIKVNGRAPLEATTEELRLFIRENFLDKDGREISPFTLDTYLKPNRDDKRLHPDSPKRIDMSAFFNTSETEKE